MVEVSAAVQAHNDVPFRFVLGGFFQQHEDMTVRLQGDPMPPTCPGRPIGQSDFTLVAKGQVPFSGCRQARAKGLFIGAEVAQYHQVLFIIQ